MDWTLSVGVFNLQGEGISECSLADLCSHSADEGLGDSDSGEDEHEKMEGEPGVSELRAENGTSHSIPLLNRLN